jgi:hypothetical protein
MEEGWTASDWIALAGLAVAAMGIIVGPIIGYWTARAIQDRKAASDAEQARRSRVQANRETTYVDLLGYVIRTAQGVERTEPFISYDGAPGPPDPLPDEEVRALEARVRAFGSPDVLSALRRFNDGARDFHLAAASFKDTRDSALRGHAPELAPSAHETMEEARQRFRTEKESFSELVNRELSE